MKKKYKFFAVSDIHGFYTELKKALDEAGFDPDDESHVLVGGGDYFDRGYENIEVYKYLRSLKRKILVRGNHEDMLLRVLDAGGINYIDVHNGTDITVAQFFGEGKLSSDGTLYADERTELMLREFIGAAVDYFESEKYVFVHGWVPIVDMGDKTQPHPMWRMAKERDWARARFTAWNDMYKKGCMIRGKTLVCGHRVAAYGCLFDPKRAQNDTSPYYGDGVIAIDACTAVSGRVNVVVIEDMAELTFE